MPKGIDYAGSPICTPVAASRRPTQYVSFVQLGIFHELTAPKALPSKLAGLLPGVTSSEVRVEFGLETTYQQIWQLRQLELGDLVSHMSLAPGEQLEVAAERMERLTFEQSREAASDLTQTTEVGATDREALTVAATTASASQWSASANVGFRLPAYGLSGGGSAGYGKQVSATSAATAERIQERTHRTATTQKTQSKITLKTTAETVITDSRRRLIKNPSDDKAMHVFAYELFKRFRVITALDSVRPVVVVHLARFAFDARFVSQNTAFLEEALFDATLRKSLPEAGAAARVLEAGRAPEAVVPEEDLRTLELMLFEDAADTKSAATGFDVDEAHGPVLNLSQPLMGYDWDTLAGQAGAETQPMANEKVFKSWTDGTGTVTGSMWWGKSARMDFEQWTSIGLGELFLGWRYLRQMYRTAQQEPSASLARSWVGNRSGFLRAFADLVRNKWSTADKKALLMALPGPGDVKDRGSQLARRLDTFLMLADVVLAKSAGATPSDIGSASDESSLGALLGHIALHADHYCGKYLSYLFRSRGTSVLVPIANAALGESSSDPVSAPTPWRGWYRADDLRLDGRRLVIPMSIPVDHDWTLDFEFETVGGALFTIVEAATALEAAAAPVAKLVAARLDDGDSPANPSEQPPPVAATMAAVVQSALLSLTALPPTSLAKLPIAVQDAIKHAKKVFTAPSPAGKKPAYLEPFGSPGAATVNPETYVQTTDEIRVLADGAHLVTQFAGCS